MRTRVNLVWSDGNEDDLDLDLRRQGDSNVPFRFCSPAHGRHPRCGHEKPRAISRHSPTRLQCSEQSPAPQPGDENKRSPMLRACDNGARIRSEAAPKSPACGDPDEAGIRELIAKRVMCSILPHSELQTRSGTVLEEMFLRIVG